MAIGVLISMTRQLVRIIPRTTLVLAATMAGSCAVRSANTAAASATHQGCSTAVLVNFIPGIAQPPSPELVSDLALRARVRLEFIRTIWGTLDAFKLSVDGSDPGCGNALQRLRQDARIRSADLDSQRFHH